MAPGPRASGASLAWLRPDNRALVAAVAAALVLLIAVPALWGERFIWLPAALLAAAACAAFSSRRTLLLAFVLTMAVPSTVLLRWTLPGGFRLHEGLLLAALWFALVDWVYRDGLRVRRSPLDGPVLAVLAAALVAAVVGWLRGNLLTVIVRDLRFPAYYVALFLVTHTADSRFCLRRLAPAVVVAGLLVSVEYVLEFVGAIDLSVGTRFVRVAREEGLVLPVALLLLLNWMLLAPQRYGRWRLAILFVPVSLAFVLTVGRGMWLSFAVGLVVTALLWYRGRDAARRRAWQAAALVLATGGAVVGAAVLFQRFSGAALGAHALARLQPVVDYRRDVQFLGRLSSYWVTIQRIGLRPVLGSGLGATLPFFVFDEQTGAFGVHEFWNVDSLYLALLWKCGVVGLSAFCWLAIAALRLAWRTFCGATMPEVRAFAGFGVALWWGMAVLGISDAALVSGRFALVFAVLMGMLAVVARDVPAADALPAAPAAAPAAAAPGCSRPGAPGAPGGAGDEGR